MKTTLRLFCLTGLFICSLNMKAQRIYLSSEIKGFVRSSEQILYPTLGKGKFRMETGNGEYDQGETRLEIFSADGKMITSSKLAQNVNKIDLSEFPKAVYFIKLYKGNRIYTNKVIIR